MDYDSFFFLVYAEGGNTIGIRCTRLCNYVEFINVPSSIVFYLEMKGEVGVHDIRSLFTPSVYAL